MKNKVLFLIQTILMYLTQVIFFLELILVEYVADVSQKLINGLLFGTFGVIVVIALLCFVSCVINLVTVRKDEPSTPKVVMIYKLIQIPFYILNFVIGFFITGGLFNPFLMIAIPFVIGGFVTFTYIDTFTTSLPNIIYLIKGMIKERKANTISIVLAILQFIFVADVVSSIIIYVRNKKKLSQ